MGRLTTHVLDTSLGRPGQGIRIEVYRLEGEAFTEGQFELVFHAGDYLRRQGVEADEPRFLDVIPLRFGVADASQHFHVPLLLSPYSYSTYRGS